MCVEVDMRLTRMSSSGRFGDRRTVEDVISLISSPQENPMAKLCDTHQRNREKERNKNNESKADKLIV